MIQRGIRHTNMNIEHSEVITQVKNVKKKLHYYLEIVKDIIGSPGYQNIYIFHNFLQETQTNFLANFQNILNSIPEGTKFQEILLFLFFFLIPGKLKDSHSIKHKSVLKPLGLSHDLTALFITCSFTLHPISTSGAGKTGQLHAKE